MIKNKKIKKEIASFILFHKIKKNLFLITSRHGIKGKYATFINDFDKNIKKYIVKSINKNKAGVGHMNFVNYIKKHGITVLLNNYNEKK